MQGICKLCCNLKTLKHSHIVPKFVGKWVKSTGVTGYLVDVSDQSVRKQDIFKEYLLCGDCEGRLSRLEVKFANKLFYPFLNDGVSVANYSDWMAKFCASLSWRALVYHKLINGSDSVFQEKFADLDAAEVNLRKFILGEQESLNQYEQHFFPLEPLQGKDISIELPVNINRYFMRAIATDIISFRGDILIYIKLPGFILLGMVKSGSLNKIRSSRISLKDGKISPRVYRFPNGFEEYIFRKADESRVAYFNLTEDQKKLISRRVKSVSDNGLESSKLAEAFMSDYNLFGARVFD